MTSQQNVEERISEQAWRIKLIQRVEVSGRNGAFDAMRLGVIELEDECGREILVWRRLSFGGKGENRSWWQISLFTNFCP